MRQNNSIITTLTAILCSTCLTSYAIAAEYKIATVDINKVVNSAPEAKAQKTSLDSQTEKAKKLIESKRDALKPLQDKAKAGSITPNSKEGEELKKLTQELVSLMREKEDEIQKAFAKSNKDLTDKALKVVASYAKDKGYNIVLDKSEALRGAILYGDHSFDITDEVVAIISK